MEEQMQKVGKPKDWILFKHDPEHEKSIKIDFSGTINLTNGFKGTVLASKGVSKNGNTKFLRLFKQTGVLFLGDEGKFTGDMTDVEIGGKKALIGWSNDKSETPHISGYANEPQVKEEAKDDKAPF